MAQHSPDDMKNGIRKRPDRTRSRSDCSVEPSKGNAPHTRTYSTTPSDWKEAEKMISTTFFKYHRFVVSRHIWSLSSLAPAICTTNMQNRISFCLRFIIGWFASAKWTDLEGVFDEPDQVIRACFTLFLT